MKASESTLANGTLPVSTNMRKGLLVLSDEAKSRTKRVDMSSGLKRLDGCLIQADKLDVKTDDRLKYIMEKNK